MYALTSVQMILVIPFAFAVFELLNKFQVLLSGAYENYSSMINGIPFGANNMINKTFLASIIKNLLALNYFAKIVKKMKQTDKIYLNKYL